MACTHWSFCKVSSTLPIVLYMYYLCFKVIPSWFSKKGKLPRRLPYILQTAPCLSFITWSGIYVCYVETATAARFARNSSVKNWCCHSKGNCTGSSDIHMLMFDGMWSHSLFTLLTWFLTVKSSCIGDSTHSTILFVMTSSFIQQNKKTHLPHFYIRIDA